jgi:hypothetical protein
MSLEMIRGESQVVDGGCCRYLSTKEMWAMVKHL